MKDSTHDKFCPKCQSPKMRDWQNLTDEQKFLVERLPANTKFTNRERKKHRFCERCFYEEIADESHDA